jgi:ribosomal protein S18 acetylase RimI-like enzyme
MKSEPDPMSVLVRRLQKEDDTQELVVLSRAFFAEYEVHHEAFFRIDSLSDEGIVGYFSSFLEREDRTAFVAFQQGRIVGYVTVLVQTQAPFWQVKRVGHISGLMVRQDARRSGIGGQLLAAARSFFREQRVRYYTVDTAAANQAAIGFYQRQGLAPLHTHFLGETGELSGSGVIDVDD